MPSYRLYETRSADAMAVAKDGVAVSGTGVYRSVKMRPDPRHGLAFHLWWDGTPSGTFELFWSDKEQPDVTTDTDWKKDASWTPTNPAGAANSEKYSITSIKGAWAIVKYTNASGSGNLFGRESE